MTKEQKQFILEKLIPFILREQGRGFDMQVWKSLWDDYNMEALNIDGRKKPSCGTVCCIGGSIEYLLCGITPKNRSMTFGIAGAKIGLDEAQSYKLFCEDINWPEPYKKKYFAAKTPYQQAKVAVSLLREAVRTDGEVLR